MNRYFLKFKKARFYKVLVPYSKEAELDAK